MVRVYINELSHYIRGSVPNKHYPKLAHITQGFMLKDQPRLLLMSTCPYTFSCLASNTFLSLLLVMVCVGVGGFFFPCYLLWCVCVGIMLSVLILDCWRRMLLKKFYEKFLCFYMFV